MHAEDTLMMNPLAREPETGDEVGGYRLGKLLGRGAHGVVYQANRPGDDRTYAVKIINTQGHAAGFTDRILRECAITTKLHHPNIVAVHEVGRVETSLYIVMDVAIGRPCDHFAEGMLGWELAVRISLEVTRALDHAFTLAHVIHRDIKPANIVVDIQGGILRSVKVVDFGLSRSVDEESAGLTMTGMVLGTPFYMSPEQARGERNLDFHTDLYAVGATLFYLIAGQPPFHGGSPVEILLKHCNEAPPNLRTLVPNCPQAVAELVARCLAKKPEDRFASFAELSTALIDTLEDNPFDGARGSEAPNLRPSTRYAITSPGSAGGTSHGGRSASSSGSDALGELFRAKLEETSQIYRRQPTTGRVEALKRPTPPGPKAAPSETPPIAPLKTTPAKPPSMLNGQVFDSHYTIIGTLGAGAMGEVYAVHDDFTGKDLAMKILSQEDMERPGAVRRFHSEASALATVDHPSFPFFAGKGSYLGRDYLLMERVVGTDLKSWLTTNGGKMTEQGALSLVLQLAQAMDRAYAKCGMVHRDLKPANLMLTKVDGHHRLKIVDFGVSTYIDFGDFEDFSAREYRYIDDDSQGKAVGTPAYMSPEQCLGQPPSPMMDIYAIGCVYFQLITGRTPYQAGNPGMMMMKHLQDPPPVFAGLADVSSGSDYLLKRCLAKKPKDRFQNYKKLEGAVTSAMHTLTHKLKRQGTEMYRRP